MVDEVVKYRLVYEAPITISPIYYWIWKYIREVIKPNELWKVLDWHRFSKRSQEWGTMEQKKVYQIEEANKLLQTIGNMSKILISMYKELQRVNEVLDLYEKSGNVGDLELKGLWADVVDPKTGASSMVNLEKDIKFITLRDFFFNIDAKTPEEVEKKVDALNVTERLKVVLKRKLIQYLTWKEHWKESLIQMKKLLQEQIKSSENSIKMYREWARPIVKNIEGLQMKSDFKDPRIFEMSNSLLSRVEIVAVKGLKDSWSKFKEKLEKENILRDGLDDAGWELLENYVWLNDLCDYGKYVYVIRVVYDILESSPQGQWAINEINFIGEVYKISEFIKKALEWEKDPYDRWFDKVIQPVIEEKNKLENKEEKEVKFKMPSNLSIKLKIFTGKLKKPDKKQAEEDVKEELTDLYLTFKKSRGMASW